MTRFGLLTYCLGFFVATFMHENWLVIFLVNCPCRILYQNYANFIELGGSHLEFPGHLADGARPATIYCQPVLTQGTLGEKPCVFWCRHTGSVPLPGDLHSITSWSIPSNAPKIHHHPEVIAHGHNSTGITRVPSTSTANQSLQFRDWPSGLHTWKTLSHWPKILCQHLFFLLELNIYN